MRFLTFHIVIRLSETFQWFDFFWPRVFNTLMVVRYGLVTDYISIRIELLNPNIDFFYSIIGMGKLKSLCGVYFSMMWFILIAIQSYFWERDDLDFQLVCLAVEWNWFFAFYSGIMLSFDMMTNSNKMCSNEFLSQISLSQWCFYVPERVVRMIGYILYTMYPSIN